MLGAGLLTVACNSDGSTATPSVAPSGTALRATPTATAAASPDVDGARAYEHVRQLADVIGPRVAGTDGEVRARDYIKAQLEQDGYDVTLEPFPFDASRFLPARVIAGSDRYGGFAVDNSPSGDVTGPVVDAGIGRPQDFPPGARGAVALIERGELTFQDKIANAAAAGATGVIIFNNAPGNFDAGADTVAVPAVTLSQQDGEALRARLAAGQVQATVSVSPPTGTSYNVIAKPKGAAQCATVTGGHYDSVPVTGGADDNASGAASVLEVARAAAAQSLPGDNCFVLFGAEELGLIGSKAFVSQLSDQEINGIRVMVNLDVVGIDSPLGVLGDDDAVETARVAGQRVGVQAEKASLPPNAGSDHQSFQQAGVPVVMLTREDSLIHTQQDTSGRVNPERLEETLKLALATLRAYAP
ncbi:MAG TPA: M28 family metallopeptidase [Dehalococcoidia bacterium]|nr:M28 family metallopeptidase [Dehalococcoidia bacterium]